MERIDMLRRYLLYAPILMALAACIPSWVWSGEYEPPEAPAEVVETVKETDAILRNSPLRGFRPKNAVKAKVVRVISGDTIEVEVKGERLLVGYIGVDAPEVDHSILGTEPYGMEALELNRKTVEDKTVWLEADLFEADNLGRALRYVFVDGLMVNALILHEGLAQPAGSPPPIKYAEVLYDVQSRAMVARKGGWDEEWQNLLHAR